jgi:thioredoxin
MIFSSPFLFIKINYITFGHNIQLILFKYMENLTTETFKVKIFNFEKNKDWKFEGTKPTIIDFYADWCSPCKMVTPILEELSQEFPDVDFYKVDIDSEIEISSAFQIRSIPALLFIPLTGTPAMGVGAVPKNALIEAIRNTFDIQHE